jgi:putative tricarboxylic transport membrane protein
MIMGELMKKQDVVSGIFLLLLGLGIIGFSSTIEVGSLANPSPGLFPLLSGIVLTGLSLVLLIQSFKLPGSEIFSLSKDGYVRVFGLLCAMFLYAIVIDFFGFIIATCFLLLYFLKMVSMYSWKNSMLYAVFISISAYAIFNMILDVGLPAGLMLGQ